MSFWSQFDWWKDLGNSVGGKVIQSLLAPGLASWHNIWSGDDTLKFNETLFDWDRYFSSSDTSSHTSSVPSIGDVSTSTPSSGESVNSLPSDSSGASISSPTDYNLAEYFEGLLSSVGAEAEITRQYNSAEAAIQREWASRENQLNRDWQTQMSNSAYQRAVSDLKAAGLNPILAASGASSTPAGVVSSGSSASSVIGNGDTMSSLLNAIANLASSVADFLPNFNFNYRKK